MNYNIYFAWIEHLWENSFTVRLAHRLQNFYHLISSQVKHTSIGSINVWLVIQFFILAYNHLPSVLLSFWTDINVFSGILSRHSKWKNFQSGQKIIQKSCSLKFTAFMHAAKQVWIWYSCLYWPTLFCIFSDIDLVLLLKSEKKKKKRRPTSGKLTSCWVNNAYESNKPPVMFSHFLLLLGFFLLHPLEVQ